MQYKKLVAATLVALLSPSPSFAGGGAMTGGATEWTQMANNSLLAKSLSQQTLMVAQDIQIATNTLNSYMAKLQDLMQLPEKVMQQMLEPFAGELKAFYKVGEAVSGLYTASNNAYSVFDKRYQDMKTMSQNGFDPALYLSYEMELAARSDNAKKAYQKDVAALEAYEEQMKHIAKVAQESKGIDSTVGGLQQVVATSALGAAQMNEVNKTLREAQAKQSMVEETTAKYDAYLEKRRAEEAESMIKDFKNYKMGVGAPSGYDLKHKEYKTTLGGKP